MFGLTLFDGGTDGAVGRLFFTVFGVFDLFVLRVNKRIVAVLAREDFVGHIGILYSKGQDLCLGREVYRSGRRMVRVIWIA